MAQWEVTVNGSVVDTTEIVSPNIGTPFWLDGTPYIVTDADYRTHKLTARVNK